MAAIESRPFRVPSREAVTANVTCIKPDVTLHELAGVWEPGQDVVFRIAAELSSAFWRESGLSESDTVMLVGTVTCLVARTRWRSEVAFARSGDAWSAFVDIEVDGAAVAVEALVDAAVVGDGRTGHPDPAQAIHRAARLWRLPATIRVPFERLEEAFPTSAVSFSETGRLRVPWRVEVAHDSEPGWGITSAVRLYLNTDLPVAELILNGTAATSVYQAIQADIYTATLFHLAAIRDAHASSAIAELVEYDTRSFAAFCASVASRLGLDLDVALSLASEEPMQLVERAREASRFMIEEE